jgi:hypothetical protein
MQCEVDINSNQGIHHLSCFSFSGRLAVTFLLDAFSMQWNPGIFHADVRQAAHFKKQ